MTRRRAQPTRSALRRRKDDVHRSFVAPALPTGVGTDMRRAVALLRPDWPIEDARLALLVAIQEHAPRVLARLADVAPDDDDGLAAWARETGIDAPWLRIVATNTFAFWKYRPAARGRQWDLNLHNKGMRVPARGRLPKRPSELLIRADHFTWLVRHHVVRESYGRLTSPPETSRKAVQALTRRLGLTVPAKK